jgi:peptide deformylase
MTQSPLAQKLLAQYPLIQGSQNPILRTRCARVDRISPDIIKFGASLLELMRLYDGVWLAAPQIGKTIRMAAFTQRDTAKSPWQHTLEDVMINPEILSYSPTCLVDEEWCLSLPGTTWLVSRSDQIRVRYTDLSGKKVTLNATWYNARIILHEIDHLDWVLFIDKLTKQA